MSKLIKGDLKKLFELFNLTLSFFEVLCLFKVLFYVFNFIFDVYLIHICYSLNFTTPGYLPISEEHRVQGPGQVELHGEAARHYGEHEDGASGLAGRGKIRC